MDAIAPNTQTIENLIDFPDSGSAIKLYPSKDGLIKKIRRVKGLASPDLIVNLVTKPKEFNSINTFTLIVDGTSKLGLTKPNVCGMLVDMYDEFNYSLRNVSTRSIWTIDKDKLKAGIQSVRKLQKQTIQNTTIHPNYYNLYFNDYWVDPFHLIDLCNVLLRRKLKDHNWFKDFLHVHVIVLFPIQEHVNIHTTKNNINELINYFQAPLPLTSGRELYNLPNQFTFCEVHGL